MNPILRNVLAVVAGAVVGMVVNMGLITIGPTIIPAPEGVDPTNVESMAAGIHLFQPKHFIFPFLAHALGALAGAYATARLAISNQLYLALFIGAFFLLGGIMAANMIPAPTWFTALDLVGAYLPMGWLGWKLASGNKASA